MCKDLSKLLKPIIESVPTNIKGTKDLALKLSKLELPCKCTWYFVTGNVVAFYPNIPLDKCLHIVQQQYEYCYGNETDEEKSQTTLFVDTLKTGNKNLILQYNNQYFLQKNSLAMGVSDSPDLATLFGWAFEMQANVMTDLRIPFYGRFIDDILMIVYASSEAEALQITSIIQFNGCKIEWGTSNHYTTFLDMTLYCNSENRVQHMPYRKIRSHQERIPWISHHLLDVK